MYLSFFFFNDTATTEIYTLSLHDALPILAPSFTGTWSAWQRLASRSVSGSASQVTSDGFCAGVTPRDRKSTRLNSSHSQISYAVFCLKKKKKKKNKHNKKKKKIQDNRVIV